MSCSIVYRHGRLVVATIVIVAIARAPCRTAEREPAQIRQQAAFVLACNSSNDLFRAMSSRSGTPPRYDTVDQALRHTPSGGALLVLADGYPAKATDLPRGFVANAAAKNIHLFVEYPASLDGLEIAAKDKRKTEWERIVVASDFFGAELPKLHILSIHDCHFLPVRSASSHLVAARVAGYDTAVFGMPPETWPILFEHPARKNVMVCTTKLSQFHTARYAPTDAWRVVWMRILRWLQPGKVLPDLKWSPAVRPSYGREETLPGDVEKQALRRGVDWYFNSRMFIHPAWQKVFDEDAKAWTDRTGPAPHLDWPSGDGSLGMLEGFSSRIDAGGNQPVRWWRRNDCNGEVAGTMALAGAALGDTRFKAVAARLADWLCFRSLMAQGKRADPQKAAYGLFGWNDIPHYWGNLDGDGIYYGDDNARAMLGLVAAASVLHDSRWDQRVSRGLAANFRVTGTKGFRPDRIDEPQLDAAGWRHYHDAPTISYDMHYQSYLWACNLWACRQTGYGPLLKRTKMAIRMSMAAYPDKWTWTESMQLERARFLLALAWMVRVEDTPEHRGWLRRMAEDLLVRQDACGAIREQLGPPGHGVTAPPRSNAEYGTAEATLVQSDSDPAADLLYTINFAFLGLHEAAAATGDPYYRHAEDKLARFFCRAQIRAPQHPELDGAWFRAFDVRLWDYWASSADAGWGAWSIEAGWTQSWIVSVLAMRQLHTSLWELGRQHASGAALNEALQKMVGQDQPKAGLKTETFARDPAWEGYNNRIVPKDAPLVTQDFGYSRTRFAAKSRGEIGGRIARASEPAWYATRITPKTLDDKLAASGTFALTKGGGAACFGWFSGQQRSGMGRPVNSLTMILSAAKTGGRLSVHLVTAQNQVCGTFVTRFERYHTPEERSIKRPTPIKNDGTRYHWKLDYDPSAADGQIRFTITSGSSTPDDFEGKVFTVDLPAGFKKQGTTFDRFGLINVTRPGGAMTVYFGDLALDGRSLDLSGDPKWDGSGNRATYRAKEVGGAQDFGFSATNHAGGTAGEVGGLIWRAPYAYYADRVGPLSLNDRLEARGRFILASGAPDSAFYFGWFKTKDKHVYEKEPFKGKNFIGISIGGPTRVGHYFLPTLATGEGRGSRVKAGPVLAPGKACEWTFLYDPAANNGCGQLRVALDGTSVTLDLKVGEKSKDAVFDRFGIFCVGPGGGQLRAYFDDLTYTASPGIKPR